MPGTSRTRRVAAPPERVWDLVADPWSMPRWWPGVQRMEGVEADRFTQVHATKRGRLVRMDFTCLESQEPASGAGLGRLVWEQELAGTPFERVLAEAITEIALQGAPEASETVVTLSEATKLRGYSRTGGFLVARATRQRLDAALAGVARALED